MPYMWRAWARKYFGNANMRPTPANQERLARTVLTAAYWKFGSWPVVAHYWLTGRGQRDQRTWSPRARRYVAKVMDYYRRYGGTTDPGGSAGSTPEAVYVQQTSPRVTLAGGWATARYPTYLGGTVAYATGAGATATFPFTGTSVSWYGPLGPTRGRAKVYLDGVYQQTVDLYRRSFSARNAIFTKTFATAGSHTLKIEVVATPSRPYVAIDAFRVVPAP
jgi:hypothetical protein